jgi:hypothetical protein
MGKAKARKVKVKVYKGLLSLSDMGGRRKLLDRRSVPASSHIPERRRFDRRSGFDRRGIEDCSIRNEIERRAAFMGLQQTDTPEC